MSVRRSVEFIYQNQNINNPSYSFFQHQFNGLVNQKDSIK